MFDRRQLFATAISAVLILLSYSLYLSRAAFAHDGSIASSQVDERDRGVTLYEQGDTVGAIRTLQAFVKKQKNDIRAWHYLGLALSRSGKTNDARKAHEKAAKIGSQLLTDQLDGTAAPRELYARIIPFKRVLFEAADSADKYLELSSKPSRSKISEWRARAERLRDFSEISDELKDLSVLLSNEVTTMARILEKASPSYTEEARQNQVTGTVVLLMIFSADGSIRGLIPIASLPYGLTEQAIKVARKIKFVPATKDGKPVSQFIKVEYNFNIY